MSHTATKLYSSSKESVQVGLGTHCATSKKQVLHLLLCYDILEWKKFLVKRLLGLYNSRFLPIASLFSCKGYNKLCPDDTGQEVNSGSERIFSPDVQQLIRICPLCVYLCLYVCARCAVSTARRPLKPQPARPTDPKHAYALKNQRCWLMQSCTLVHTLTWF